MSDERLTKYQAAKRVREQAEEWNTLPYGPKYENDIFNISVGHCRAPKLVRSGQQTCGGKNYWETGEDFNNALLEHIVADWDSIYQKVLRILQGREVKSLKECQKFIDQMQAEIDSAADEDYTRG